MQGLDSSAHASRPGHAVSISCVGPSTTQGTISASGQTAPWSRAGSPVVSDQAEPEVLLMATTQGQPRKQHMLTPSYEEADDFGQMTAAGDHGPACQQGPGHSKLPNSAIGVPRDALPAAASLPPPAFQLLRQQPAGHAGHSERQGAAFAQHEQYAAGRLEPWQQQQGKQQQPAALRLAPVQSVGWPRQAPDTPAAAAAAPAPEPGPTMLDRTSELAQLLASLTDEELQAVVMRSKVLKAEGSSPTDELPPDQLGRATQQPHLAPETQLQQQRSNVQPSQQAPVPVPYQALTATVSAPPAGGQRAPVLAATLSGPAGPAAWCSTLQPNASQAGSQQPPRQQPLSLPRFLPEAECQQGQLMTQPQLFLQQRQQQSATPRAVQTTTSQQWQPHGQVLQGNVAVRPVVETATDARPPQVRIPPVPQQPADTAALNLLHTMQALMGANQHINTASQQQQQQQPSTRVSQPQEHPSAGAALLEAAVKGMASAVLQGASAAGVRPPAVLPGMPSSGVMAPGNGPRPPPPPPPAAVVPPAAAPPAAAGGMLAVLQQLLAAKPGPAAAPAPAGPGPVHAAPAAQPAGQQQQLQQRQQQQQQQPQPQQGLESLLGMVASAMASVGRGGSSPAASPGNKRLMAAAKDLLEALSGADGTGRPAAAVAPASTQEAPLDPVAAAAAPRDVPLLVRYQEKARSSTGQRGEHRTSAYDGQGDDEEDYAEEPGRHEGSRGRGRNSSHSGRRMDEGSTYGNQPGHQAAGVLSDRAGGRRGKRTGRGTYPTGKAGLSAAAAGMEGKNNLFALLAALEQQEQDEEGSEGAGGYMDEADGERTSYYAAGAWDDAAVSEPDHTDTEASEQHLMDTYDDEVGDAAGQHSLHPRRQVQRHSALAAARLKARHKQAPVVSEALAKQRWLLKQRAGGKRPVKPNEAFVSFTAPTPHALPPRPKPVRRDVPVDFDPTDRAAVAAQPVEFIDGPHLPRRRISRPHTSWGWYLLGKGHLQQQDLQVEGQAGKAGAVGLHLDLRSGEVMQHSGSSSIRPPPAAAAAAAGTGSDGLDGGVGESDAAEAAAANAAVGELTAELQPLAAAAHTQQIQVPTAAAGDRPAAGTTGPAAAAAGTGGDDGVMADASDSTAAAAAASDSRKHRWTAGTHQWVTEDGLTIWPKDTLITPEQRVFYVAFKWVQRNWPNRVGRDSHITSLPVDFWVDGQETSLRLTARIRLYDKAAHMVISPYSGLSKRFAGKWLAGYGFDARRGVVRVYVSSEQPILPKPAGNRWGSRGRPGAAAATSAGAAGAVNWPMSAAQQLLPPGAAAAGGSTAQESIGAAAGGSADSAQPQAAGGGLQTVSGRKRRKTSTLLWPGGTVGVPSDVLAEATHGGLPAAGARQQPGPQLLSAVAALPTEQQASNKRARLSRSAAAGVVAATIAAGAGNAPVPAEYAGKDPAEVKSLMRSAQGRAAVARRWAKYREAQAAAAAAANAQGPAATAAAADDNGPRRQQQQQKQQQPVLLLPQLGGGEFAADIGVINNALLCVSDTMKLPEELLVRLSEQLVQVLAAAEATRADEGQADGSVDKPTAGAQGGVGARLHVSVQAWYQQLCGAVGACNGSLVAQLIEELSSKVLQTAC